MRGTGGWLARKTRPPQSNGMRKPGGSSRRKKLSVVNVRQRVKRPRKKSNHDVSAGCSPSMPRDLLGLASLPQPEVSLPRRPSGAPGYGAGRRKHTNTCPPSPSGMNRISSSHSRICYTALIKFSEVLSHLSTEYPSVIALVEVCDGHPPRPSDRPVA